MNTRERLREQRKTGRYIGWPMGFGLAIGLATGYVLNPSGVGSGLAPEWAYSLITFCLGGVCALTGVWLIGRKNKNPGSADAR